MTGKELIMYILQNNLENEVIFKDGAPVGFMTEEEVAVKYNVGITTARMWYECGIFDGIKIGKNIYFLPKRKEV